MHEHILLVEDNKLIAMAEARSLRSHGFRVTSTATGERAVRLAASNQDISLILMDIDLGGGIDGLEAAQRIRALRDLPVVFLSSHTENYYLEAMEEVSSYGFVPKQAGEIHLIQAVNMALKLHHANRRLQIMEAAPTAIVSLDRANRIIEWNPAAEKLFGYSKTEAAGRNLNDLLLDGDPALHRQAQAFTDQVLEGFHVTPIETLRYTKHGRAVHVITASSPLTVDGRMKGIVSLYNDISARKEKEAEAAALLEEKEELLKEVHHRIKNHMSTIAGIISLHLDYYNDQHTTALLKELHGKINIMQNIYTMLYEGENVDSVPLRTFIKSLLRNLNTAYVHEKQIALRSSIADICLNAHQSLPVGIIINELVTNSLKYSFPDREEGTVSVCLSETEEGYLMIEVSDNGVGMPDAIMSREEYGFGLTLVKGYVRQFAGEMDISNRGGTTVRVLLEMEDSRTPQSIAAETGRA
jgi:PAS domain S-box-containing protein